MPLALRVAAPVARPYAWRLTGAGAMVLLQVAFVLAKPWPLALAVDHALSDGAPPLSVPVLGELSEAAVLVLAGIDRVLISALLGLLDMASSASPRAPPNGSAPTCASGSSTTRSPDRCGGTTAPAAASCSRD